MTPSVDSEVPSYNLSPSDVTSNNHSHFENTKANLFPINSISDEAYDPDANFFNDKLDEIDSKYYTEDQLIQFPRTLDTKTFSIFHLNIRSLNKNIENLQNLVSGLKDHFKIIVLKETWCGYTATKNSIYQILNYTVIHKTRK